MDPHNPPLAASSHALRWWYLVTSKTHILWHHSSFRVCRTPLDCTIDFFYLLCRYRTRDCTQASKTSTALVSCSPRSNFRYPVEDGMPSEQQPPRYLPRGCYDVGMGPSLRTVTPTCTCMGREREREICIFPWLQVHITGPRHHLASSLHVHMQGT